MSERDNYFFLLRIGDNYREYSFSWEPFRDLAGPLEAGISSLPIVVVSDAENRQAPEVRRSDSPSPHIELWVSPVTPAAAIANAWLELLVEDGAQHAQYHGPFDWFARNLDIPTDALSSKAKSFLKWER